MLQGLFNYDNPVWRFIGKLGDLIILNVLWIVCSIPIFTIGASTTAVYYVTLKMVRDEEDSTIKSFFRSFKSNFKQATAIWLILLAAGAVLALSLIHICLAPRGFMALKAEISGQLVKFDDQGVVAGGAAGIAVRLFSPAPEEPLGAEGNITGGGHGQLQMCIRDRRRSR